MAQAHDRTLKFKTCNATDAGTVDPLSLSFCGGESDCVMGSPNAYNLRGELELGGAWNQFEVPLEFEPTTMEVTLQGIDAWCIEEVVWEEGGNLLGRGARLYLDSDFGYLGCNYGVHINTGRFYPCQSTWRFFNLQTSDEFKDEVAVKSCKGHGASTVLASICSESRCDDTMGDVVSFNLTTREDSGDDCSTRRWTTTRVSAGFNPVAMELSNDGGGGDSSWCADEISFNGYRLLSTNLSPVEHVLKVGEQRYFYNLQLRGLGTSWNEICAGDKGSELEDKALEVVTEVIIALLAGLLFYVTVALAKYAKRVFDPRSARATAAGDTAAASGDDDGGGGDPSNICAACGGHMSATVASGPKRGISLARCSSSSNRSNSNNNSLERAPIMSPDHRDPRRDFGRAIADAGSADADASANASIANKGKRSRKSDAFSELEMRTMAKPVSEC